MIRRALVLLRSILAFFMMVVTLTSSMAIAEINAAKNSRKKKVMARTD